MNNDTETAIRNSLSISISLLPITSSMRILLAPGSTRPERRLIIIRPNPTSNSFLRGQIMVLKTLAMVIRFLGFFFWSAMKCW